MRDADAAMYRAKEEGRGRKRVFSARMRDEVRERQRIEAGLRLALERAEFELHYQPLVSLSSGMAVSVEALIRWREPARGLIPPGVFIPVAEACGLILPISEWVLQAACVQARSWLDRWGRTMPIAINVPPALLNDVRLALRIATELERNRLPGEALAIEIVETSVLETQPSVLTNLNQLRELGVKIAIDDFGTGYSSFAYLKRLPICYLKIDRSLAQNVPTDPTDTAICKAIAAMGAQLGLGVVAEGVEAQAQADFLRLNGCGIAQGFYFSRPLPAADCTMWLEQFGGFAPSLLAV
jgi:EAL domain-containing protein (putative c-di-GMP-specific phosphodiesterase class I)